MKTLYQRLSLGIFLSFILLYFSAHAAVSRNAKIMFVQNAQQARFEPMQPGHYKVILSGVDKKVIWFTDRPVRNAGMVTMEHYIKNWSKGQNSFKLDHPNATLVGDTDLTGYGKHVSVVLTLAKPHYNPNNHTLSYQAKVDLASNQLSHDSVLYNTAVFVDGNWKCPFC